MACLCGSGYAVEGKPRSLSYKDGVKPRLRLAPARKLVVGDIIVPCQSRVAMSYPGDLVRVTRLLYSSYAVIVIGSGISTGLLYKLHRLESEVMAVVVR